MFEAITECSCLTTHSQHPHQQNPSDLLLHAHVEHGFFALTSSQEPVAGGASQPLLGQHEAVMNFILKVGGMY